ncbi:MAG: type I restriction endonuclease subunit R [Planctomycetes bacterium]|nr:type I restriction endonuclease subunit R [Planctomycetota bacterium]
MLAAMGWEILPQAECESRRGRMSRVLLESVLTDQLLKINRFTYRGKEYAFDASDAADAIRQLRPDPTVQRGLVGTNQMLHERLVLGATISKTVEGDRKSYTMRFIDWDKPENNLFQATPEFSVDRNDGKGTSRCDIVLLVNGIPFGVIENKASSVEVMKGVRQLISYQSPAAIAPLFHTVQLLLAMKGNEALYAAVGSGRKFWLKWREHHDDAIIGGLINRPLSADQLKVLFTGDFANARKAYDQLRAAGVVAVTEQDRVLHALCRKERILELARTFSLFDDGKRKIARHQQFFGVKAVIEQMKQRDSEGRRKGGVVWHTQGSGKSLTMVMLGKALALDREFENPRLIIVTDRTELDVQIKQTFQNCDRLVRHAGTGAELLARIKEKTTDVITTVINKFETAVERSAGFKDDDPNVIVLVDEGHRTQHGNLATNMRRLLTKACYVGFTGTPVLSKDKATISRFGGIIRPTYTIEEAVKDGAIVPLIYEGRFVAQHVQKGTVDAWFEKVSAGLSEKQMADLKRKYSRINILGQTEQAIYAKALDISEHFHRVWKDSGFKGQVVAPSKAAAIRMKEIFDELGQITTEVVISGPNARDTGDEVEEEGNPEDSDKVTAFWRRMMSKYGDEKQYADTITKEFKGDGGPDVVIVVSKLLTGFDCDRNVALYICKPLADHNLLQAIARVNRNCELPIPGGSLDEDGEPLTLQKRNGYIYDYEGLLEELSEAMSTYKALQGFEEQDRRGVVTPIQEIIKQLPGAHRRLLDLFKPVKNKLDHEQMEQHLRDEEMRKEFSKLLTEYARLLEQALGSEKTFDFISDAEMEKYKADWRRMTNLRRSAALRYQDAIDIREYEPRILRLLNDHVAADPAEMVIKPIDLSIKGAIEAAAANYHAVVGNGPGETARAKADRIERAAKKYIRDRLEQYDPSLARKFSEMIEQALNDYAQKRIDDQALADRLSQISEDMVEGRRDDVLPEKIRSDADAVAFYGLMLPLVRELRSPATDVEEMAAEMASHVKDLLLRYKIVRFWSNHDAQNRFRGALDDYFFDDVGGRMGVKIPVQKLDELQEALLTTARHRFPDV